MARNAVENEKVSVALACRAFEISEICYHYKAILNDENAEIADWLIRLTTAHRRWGFKLCFLYLRNVKGLALRFIFLCRLCASFEALITS